MGLESPNPHDLKKSIHGSMDQSIRSVSGSVVAVVAVSGDASSLNADGISDHAVAVTNPDACSSNGAAKLNPDLDRSVIGDRPEIRSISGFGVPIFVSDQS